jgi:hypothetical protein
MAYFNLSPDGKGKKSLEKKSLGEYEQSEGFEWDC